MKNMKENREDRTSFDIGKDLKARAVELVAESQTRQFSEGIRIGGALSSVYAREYKRIESKYGTDHPRTREMAVRVEAGSMARKDLFVRYVSASITQTDPGEGWVVDGFVRTGDGAPVPGVTVAGYDRQERWYPELGYSCTDERGYFSIVVDKLPDKPPRPVFMRVSKDKKLLTSSVPQLNPASRATERIDIVIGDTSGKTAKGDCTPPDGKTVDTKTVPPDPVEPVRYQPKETPGEKTGEKTVEPAVKAETLKGKPDEPAVKTETLKGKPDEPAVKVETLKGKSDEPAVKAETTKTKETAAIAKKTKPAAGTKKSAVKKSRK